MQETGTKGMQDSAQLIGEEDPLRTVQESDISLYWQMVYAQTRICPTKWNVIWSTNG